MSTSQRTRSVILAAIFFAAAATVTGLQDRKRVLMLSEFRPDTPANIGRERLYRETLDQALPGEVDYYAEYIDAPAFRADDYAPALREFLQRKYGDRRIDVVLAVGAVALRLVQTHGRDLFPGASVIASNVDKEAIEEARAAPALPLTGVPRRLDPRGTVNLILSLQPQTKSVVFIAGGAYARYFETLSRQQVREFDGRIAFDYWIDLTMEDWLERVAKLEPGTAVVYMAVFQDGAGRRFLPTEALAMITRASAVPVYGIIGTHIEYGIVGGSLHDTDMHAREVAALTVRVLRGERVENIPIQDSNSLVPAVNWTVLRRWGLNERALPAGTVVVHRDLSVWERYRWPIVAALSVVVLQAIMIAGLIVQRARRRETEARNTAILRAMPDMMFLLNREGVFLDFHAPDPHSLLAKPEQFLGKNMRDVLPGPLANAFEEKFARLSPGQPPEIIEYSLPMPDGDHQYESRVVPVTGTEVLAIVRDITDRRRADESLREAQTELRRVSRLTALGEFAAALAHEVRQPLTAIIMNARSCLHGLARPTPDVDEVRAGLLDVVEASQRAEQVIQRNRELFRHHTVETGPLDINGVIRDASVLTMTRLQDSQVTLMTSLDQALPPVSGDRIELQQVLLNLIANAIDAMERVEAPARVIELASTLTPDGMVQVSVSDRGVGLGGVDLQRMFALSYTTKASGTGVGLSISQSIVEAHGGRLWAEPNEGRGARFCFTVPVRTSGAAVAVSNAYVS